MASYKTSDLSRFTLDAGGWEKSSGGNTCKAKRNSDGVVVFIKRYSSFREPVRDASTSPEVYNKRLKTFERLFEIRSKINQLMRAVSGRGGNIIIPYDEFVCEHMYTEVAEFVPGLMSPDEILAMSYDEKLKFAMTAINALQVVHEQGVIHIDIKPPNVIAVRNTSGMAVGKIIDFDSSLLKDLPVPDETGGDTVFMSPELAYYADSEGDPEVAELISEKTDIYSMGLTLHYYLSGGKLPGYAEIANPKTQEWIAKKEAAHKPVFCWEPLLGDGRLVMDASLPGEVAEIIEKMVSCDPSQRPTCREVFTMLAEVIAGGGKGKIADKFDPPLSADTLEWDEDKMKADGYTGIHYDRGMRKYSLTKNGSALKRMTAAELKKAGYAKEAAIIDEFEPPIPSDGLEWDISRLTSRGYTGIHPAEGGKYSLTQNGRSLSTCAVSYLVSHGFAKAKGTTPPPKTPVTPEPSKTPKPSGFEDPDPEDGFKWDVARLQSKSYTGARSLGGGDYELFINGYSQGKYGKERLIRLKYAVPVVKREEDVFQAPDPADGFSAWNEDKLKSRGYTGIRPLGGGKYVLISNGRQQGEYDVDKLLRHAYAFR